MYRILIKPLLFSLQPETAHHIAFRLLKLASFIPGINGLIRNIFQISDKRLGREILGIRFPNPVGLAAGFDKDAKAIDGLGNLGFGFIEVGTLTPKGQSGNDKPRLFRLPKDKALINRMGFNNEGMDAAVIRLKKRKSNVIVGGNIGKNKITPNEDAYNDYELCLDTLYDYVDYFVINISSPNTPGLRELQEKEPILSEETLTHIDKLMDYYDRIEATKNSALNIRAGLNFLNSLLLPVLAFIIAISEKISDIFFK